MRAQLYTREGRFVTQIIIASKPEAIIWDHRTFLKVDEGYLEVPVLPADVREVYTVPPREDREPETGDWGEAQIGNESKNW